MNISLDRFQITEGCPASPGRCAGCGNTEGLMVDWGLDLDFYGVVYLCLNNCVVEICNKLGYYTPAQVTEIKEAFDALVLAQEDLIAHNKELTDAVDSLSRLRLDVGSDQHSLDNLDHSFSTDERAENSGSATRNRKSKRAEQRPAQQTDEPGSASVHSDDSLEEFGL